MSLQWQWRGFEELRPDELYALLQLRQAVFVVEQNCPFLDADDKDANAFHLLGRDASGQLQAYLRVHRSGVLRDAAVISRVVTAQAVRRSGCGLALMSRAVAHLRTQEEGATMVWLGAQQRLEDFYARFGFVTSSAPYLEDDIWHVGMQAPVAELREVPAVC